MDRRTLIVSGLASFGAAELARAQPAGGPPAEGASAPVQVAPLPPAAPASSAALSTSEAPSSSAAPPSSAAAAPAQPASPTASAGGAKTYSSDEIVTQVSDFLGVTAESAGAAVERIFKQQGRPTAYIAGEEGAGAFAVGLRYGRGMLYMKERAAQEVFWQGPSLGWDFGANASRVFTLCYNLQNADQIFQRFPGVEGTAYLIAGIGVNYQSAYGITLAPMRAGVGVRLGANLGYLAYTRARRVLPF
jgi:hypothetical protein